MNKELKAKIEAVLVRKDKVGMVAVGRALVHLRNRQTADEVASGTTRVHNGMGFMPQHAEIGTSMANFFEKNGYLSPKQVAYWQGTSEKIKKPRITRYWKQLMEEAERKAALASPAVTVEEDDVEGMDDDALNRLGVK